MQLPKLSVRDWLILGLSIAVIVLISLNQCNSRKLSESRLNYAAAADSLRTTTNKLGEQEATIKSFQTQNKAAFLALRSRDAEIIKLQELVESYKGRLNTAIVASSETLVQGEAEKDSSGLVKWTLPYESGRIWDTGTGLKWDIKVKNEISITIGKPRWNPFKRQDPEITITQHNKNSSTTSVRSVTFQKGQSRIGVGGYVGYGMTFGWTGQVHHGFQVGIGATWRIFP